MIKRKQILVSVIAIASMLFVACSSNVKKAYIPNTANPQEEMTKLETEQATAVSNNIDVLASKEFKLSTKWLEEAKSDLRDKDSQENILDDLRKSRGALEDAYQAAQKRSERAPGLFAARQAAMAAGVARFAELRPDLNDVDEDTSDVAPELQSTSTEKINTLRERYVTLERKATVLTQLGNAQAQFNGAKKDGGSKLLPATFKKADLSLKNAESVISANVRNPEGYRTVVAGAVSDTELLNDAMLVIKQNGKSLSEATALKMVSQNRKIKTLNSDLSDSEAESLASKNSMNRKNDALSAELEDKTQDLQSASATMQTQRAMEEARSQFTSDEAEAYQQGPNLLIRMKKMSFVSGRADLPEESLQLLAKISNVAKTMRAKEIKVEGHTDSVGTAQQNLGLSKSRADAVATYFKTNGFSQVTSQGFGFEKPLATNKSSEGRAQNRRVDIIITPMETTTQE